MMRKMKMTLLLAMALLTLGFAGCEGKSGNRQLKEAAAIHEEVLLKYDSIYHTLTDKREEINDRIGSLDAERRSANESMLRSIKKSLDILEGWEESLVGVPGYDFEQSHQHGEEGHNHKHANENDAMLRGMSDKEVLELQKALRGRLNEVAVEIGNLMDTIKMYEKRD
jgi:hypothetical protein